MKKILFIAGLVFCSVLAKAQTNPFPSTDSLEKFINRWIRNSPVEAFQNLRMNTALIGMLRFLQNSEAGSGVDTMYLVGGCTLRLTTSGGDTMNVNFCGKLDSVTIETATDPDPDTLFEWRGATRSLVGLIPKGGGSLTSTRVAFGSSSNTITDDVDFTYNSTTNQLTVGHGVLGTNIPSTTYLGVGSKSAFGNHAPVISFYNPNSHAGGRRWEINVGDPTLPGTDSSFFLSLYNDAGTVANFPLIMTRSGDSLMLFRISATRTEIHGLLEVNGSAEVRDSLVVGTLRTGGPTDSVVVWDAVTQALKKIAQSSISGGSSGDTTYTEKPIYVKTGSNDTLAVLYDETYVDIDGDSALTINQSNVSTVQRLQDTAAAIRADFPAGSQDIQQVLTVGDTAQRAILFKDPGVVGSSHSFLIERVVPPNYNTAYSSPYGRGSLFNRGYSLFASSPVLNPTSGRPNITFTNFAYNMAVGSGARQLTDEAAISDMWETHFETGGAQPYFEHYYEMVQSDAFSYRPFFSLFQKNARLHTYTRKISTENVLYLSPTGADDTALVSLTPAGQAWGSIGDYAFSTTNRRRTQNTFMFSTGDDGPTIGGTGFNQNRLSISVPIQVGGYIRNTSTTWGGNVTLEQTGVTNHLRFLTTAQGNTTRAGIFNQQSTNVDYIGIGINSSFLFGNGVTANTGGSAFFTTNNSVPSIQFATKAAGSTTDIVAGVFGQNGNFNVGGGAVVSPPTEITVDVRGATDNNTVSRPFTIRKLTTGTPAAGFGSGMLFRLENASTAAEKNVAAIDAAFADAANNTEDADIIFSTITNNSLTEKARITHGGTLNIGTYTAGANVDSRGAYFRRSIGMHPDSNLTTASLGSDFVMVLDATTGQFKKITGANLGVGGTDTHIGNTNLTLTGNRTLTMSGNTLNMTGGNVGFSTTGPDRKVDILDNAAAQLRLTHTDGSVYADQQVDANGVLSFIPTGRTVRVPTGSTSNFAKLGGVIWSDMTVASTSGTGETDLYTYTTPTNTLGVDGEWLEYNIEGIFNPGSTVAGATMTVRAYWAGTEILEAASSSTTAAYYVIRVRVMRTSSSNARVMAYILAPGVTFTAVGSDVIPRITNITTTFSSTNIIKVTGQTTDGTQGLNVQLGDLKWWPENGPAL